MTDAPGPRPRSRPLDVAVTVGLLVIGALNVITSFASIADLGRVIDESYTMIGIPGRFQATDAAATVGFVVNVIWVAALLWSGAVAIRRLRAGRIAFWVPLLAGVLTGIVMLVAVGLLMGGDPAFQEFVQAPAAP